MTGRKKLQKKDMAAAVMKELQKRDIKMHSKSYFWILSAVAAIGVGATTIAAVYFVHIVTFVLRSRPIVEYLGFGGAGLGHFIRLFPWGWLVLGIASIVLLLVLLRRYEFSWRRNFYAIVVGLGTGLIIVGSLTALAGINLPGRPLPPGPTIRPRHIEDRTRLIGTVSDVEDDSFSLEENDGEQVEVIINGRTIGKREIQLGRWIKVLGQWHDDDFEAHAIKPVHGPSRPR